MVFVIYIIMHRFDGHRVDPAQTAKDVCVVTDLFCTINQSFILIQ
jgi:hypothetical protein